LGPSAPTWKWRHPAARIPPLKVGKMRKWSGLRFTAR
jgi:hypothetical protein